MTKPATPPPTRIDIVEVEVEIDAMDVDEWESGQRTPQASDANLAELLRRSAPSPAPPSRSPIVSRARTRTQIGAPVIARPPGQRVRTVPRPAPRPARALPVAAPPPVPVAAPPPEPEPLSPAAHTAVTVDLSLPVTATGETREIDFSLPVTATGETREIDFSLPVTATGDSDARPPEPAPPKAVPVPISSDFAEPSRVGPGSNASPAGGRDVNTAWPPRPVPVEAAAPDPLAVEPRIPPASPPEPRREPSFDDAGGLQRQVLPHPRRWWIGGGLASTALGMVVAAVAIRPSGAPSTSASTSASSSATATEAGDRPAATAVAPPEHSPAPAQTTAHRAPAVRPSAPRPAAPAAAPVAARAAAASSRPMAVAMASAVTAPRPAAVGHSAAPRAAKKPAAHRVIVDYSAGPGDPAPGLVAQSEEDPAVGRARAAYAAGNQKLFAGDLTGAIRAYRQALAIYPGYVGGYRGLGLAYAQLGDTASALAALRTYVATAPNARDVALIKRRIAHLQAR